MSALKPLNKEKKIDFIAGSPNRPDEKSWKKAQE